MRTKQGRPLKHLSTGQWTSIHTVEHHSAQQVHIVAGTGPQSRGNTLRDSICTPLWKRQNYRDRELISGCQGGGVGEGWTPQGREILGVMRLSCIRMVVVITRLYPFIHTAVRPKD